MHRFYKNLIHADSQEWIYTYLARPNDIVGDQEYSSLEREGHILEVGYKLESPIQPNKSIRRPGDPPLHIHDYV